MRTSKKPLNRLLSSHTGYKDMKRRSIQDFSLANPVYVGSSVSFYQIDDSGNRLLTLATLYENPTGSGTLTNPQLLDSDGKFVRPVYIEEPVIGEVSGTSIETHDTGIISAGYRYRGVWVTATRYFPNDTFIASTDADGSGDLYIVSDLHTSGVFADDLTANHVEVVIDVSVLADQFTVPATGGNNNKVPKVNAAGTAYIMRTMAELLADIGAEPADTEILKGNLTKELSTGFTTEVNSYGNTTDNPIIDLTKTFLTSMANNGIGVITADKVNNNSVDVWVTNTASAGALDISSFDFIDGSFGEGDGVITVMHLSTVGGKARISLEVLS